MLPTTRNKAIQCYGYMRLTSDSEKCKKSLTRLQGVFNNPKLLNTVFNLASGFFCQTKNYLTTL